MGCASVFTEEADGCVLARSGFVVADTIDIEQHELSLQ
jgi:hypothetical protein